MKRFHCVHAALPLFVSVTRTSSYGMGFSSMQRVRRTDVRGIVGTPRI